MQNDLISRSALKKDLLNRSFFPSIVKAVLEKAPAVDAVEVVRCKNCEHWHEETGWCDHHSHFIMPDGEACHPWESSEWKMFDCNDFCSYGKRRKDNAAD